MNERIRSIVQNPLTIPIAVGVVSFGAGVGAGYILARRTGKEAELYEIPQINVELTEEDLEKLQELEDDLDELEEDLEEILDLPSVKPEDVDEFVKTALETFPKTVEVDGEKFEAEDEEHLKVVGSPAEVTPIRRNAFAGNDDDWNYPEEARNRTTEAPYILHKDEFYADEKDYSQLTLTYYAGDNIMVDDDESPIYNHERIVGPLRFGHGSGDPKVFYVRNDRMKAEYEILEDQGLYSVEVLGLEIENNQRAKDLKHMHEPAKFRRE